MKWREFVQQQIIDFCESAGSRPFSLKEFTENRILFFEEFAEIKARENRTGTTNKNIIHQVRKQMQTLRDSGVISFLVNSGHYTLRETDLFESEKKETSSIDLSKETPERREYVMETYVRNVTWARKAQEVLGMYCLYEHCSNTFLREDGTPYIEVHHIIPLCKGGEDGLWNLSVLCAHHHRMAHYGDSATRNHMEKYLKSRVRSELLQKDVFCLPDTMR